MLRPPPAAGSRLVHLKQAPMASTRYINPGGMYGARWQFKQASRIRSGNLVAGFANPEYLFEIEAIAVLENSD